MFLHRIYNVSFSLLLGVGIGEKREGEEWLKQERGGSGKRETCPDRHVDYNPSLFCMAVTLLRLPLIIIKIECSCYIELELCRLLYLCMYSLIIV